MRGHSSKSTSLEKTYEYVRVVYVAKQRLTTYQQIPRESSSEPTRFRTEDQGKVQRVSKSSENIMKLL